MGTNRFWYNDGKIEALNSEPNPLRGLLLNFGRGLHITWRTSGNRIPFFEEQFSVLNDALLKNQLQTEDDFNELFLQGIITRLINRNRIFKGALIHILFVPGYHQATNDTSSLFIVSEDWPEEKFILNSRGLKLGWMKEHVHPGAWIMQKIGHNHMIHLLWENEQKRHNWDTAYFTNTNGKIVECNNASFFLVKGSKLYTPSINLGICPYAIRSVILRLASTLELQIIETDQLEPAHLDAADEIFIANDQKGIQWIVGHREKRFFKKYSELLNTLINSEWARVY